MNTKPTFGLSIFILLFCIIVSCSTSSDPIYTLNTSVSPGEGGSVSPAQGEYDSGTEVQITASPNENWVFQKWEGDQGRNCESGNRYHLGQ